MTMRTSPHWAAARGFSLIELMIVVVIASILLAIAIPSYQTQIRKSRRTDIRTALLDLAGREERYLTTNNSYSASLVSLGYSAEPPLTIGSGYYQISALATTAVAGAPPHFIVTAVPIGTQLQDTQCQQFQLDSLGNQTSTPSAATTCWSN